MIQINKRKRSMILICFCIALISNIFSVTIYADEKKEKTIRVGFPIQEGLTMRDEDGNLSGYTYDYLMEISQYTGWNYEFVLIDGSINEQLMELMKMLEEGDIDILGGLYYDESLTTMYSYTGYCYGINYMGLFVPEESKLRESSLYNFNNIKVGVHSKDMTKNKILDQYAQMNNVNVEQVITGSADDFYHMIEDKKVEALLSTDIAMAAHKNMFSVAHFSPKPFYFATTKGNTDIVSKLNYAISTIDQVNPNFMNQLYNEYFSFISKELLLSDDEQEYLKKCGTLEVAMYNNKPPFQYADETGEPIGIIVEILNRIADNVGFKLHYNMVSTYEDYITLIKTGKVDIGADSLINFQDAKDTESLLTLPWCELPISVMLKGEKNFNETGKAAVPYYLKNVVSPADNLVFFDSENECLESVQKGETEFCYIGDFGSQYFWFSDKYNDLSKLTNSGISNQKLCFGIANDNLNLLMIFNKGISNLPKETINEMIYKNTYQQQPESLESYLRRNQEFLMIAVLTFFTIILIIWFYVKVRQQHRIAFENKRYDAISNLANDFFYEYNIEKDELILSDKCANYFESEHKIQKFSKKLSEKPKENAIGIWQIGEYIIHNSEGSIELSCEMPDQSRQWIKIMSSNIQSRKKQSHAVGKITNIQDIKTEQIRLEQQATIDNLTGIYNMATVKGLIKNSLEQFDSTVPCALLLIDIDNFKKINDTYGHHTGDAVLTQVAGLISASFLNDLTGRLGGDEFILFVENITKSGLELKCNQLCSNMKNKTQEMLGSSFTCSIGITWVEEGKTYETLYQEADSALYATKAKNKDGFSFYQTM